MKNALILVGLVHGWFGASVGMAQNVPVEGWDFQGSPAPYLETSSRAAGVQTAPVTMNENGGLTLSNVSNGSLVLRSRGWPSSVGSAMTTWRSSVNPIAGQKVLYSQFRLGPTNWADISNATVSLRYRRTSTSSSPSRLRAFLTWGPLWKPHFLRRDFRWAD